MVSESKAIAVIAGPGSGKTRTIVHRVAYLIKVKRVDPHQILILAYNRNAIIELRVRLQKLVGSLASRLRIFTFHGLALALLGRTVEDSKTTTNDNYWSNLLKRAGELIEKGSTEEEDIQARRIELLGNLEYIFVDEYQDVAEDEYRLIKLIAGLETKPNNSTDNSKSVEINLCIIGDDDQNIYQFRGTNAQYILQFKDEYNAEQFILAENYRSTESIIAQSNLLIQHNQQRCKTQDSEQVKINQERAGTRGEPVTALLFEDKCQQGGKVTSLVKQ